jgi:hypothetical protein
MVLLERLTNPKRIALIGNINNQDVGIVVARNLRSSSVKRSIFRIMDREAASKESEDLSIPNFPSSIDVAVISSQDPNASRYVEICSMNEVPYVFLLASAGELKVRSTHAEDYMDRYSGSISSPIIFGPNSAGICDSSTDLNLSIFEPGGYESSHDKQYALLAVDCNRFPLVSDEFRKFRSDIGFFLDFGSSYGDSEIFTEIGSYLDNYKEISALAILISHFGCATNNAPDLLKSNFKKPVIVYRARKDLQRKDSAENNKIKGGIRNGIPAMNCIEAKDLYDVTDFARVIALNPAMKGMNVSILSAKIGSETVAQEYITSSAFGMKLEVPHLGISAKAKLTSLFGKGYASHNPLTLGQKEREKIGHAIEILMGDRNTDAIFVIVKRGSHDITNGFANNLEAEKVKKPIIVALIGSNQDDIALKELSGSKIAVYPSIRRAITALKALAAYSLKCEMMKTSQQV